MIHVRLFISLSIHGDSFHGAEEFYGACEANQKEIAAACHIEPGSLTSVLNRMEEKGLIERRILDGNRRTFYIFMTEEGARLKDVVEVNFLTIEEKVFKDIPKEEQDAFMQTFSKIYENLSNKGETINE